MGVNVPIGDINPNDRVGLDYKGRSWLKTECTECVSLDDTEHVSLDEHTECIFQFHFYLHRIVRRHNSYIECCYAHNKRPLQAKLKGTVSVYSRQEVAKNNSLSSL